MSNRIHGTMIAVAFATAVSGAASAGPCTDQIAALSRTLSDSPSLGPITTGTLGGPGAATPSQPATPPSPAGTSADARVGGTAGTKEANAAVGNLIATSPQDVRRQQEGLPTAAATAAAGSAKSVETTPGAGGGAMPNDRMSQAKAELERARVLDQQDDKACSQAVDRTRQLMG